MAGSPRGERRTWHGVVDRTQWLTPALVRVVLTGDELRELPALTSPTTTSRSTSRPAGRNGPRGRSPGRIRSAGSTARPTSWPSISWCTAPRVWPGHGPRPPAPGICWPSMAPAARWGPDPSADVHLLVGDESAVPAIAAALERLPRGAAAEVFVEVEGPGFQPELRRRTRHPGALGAPRPPSPTASRWLELSARRRSRPGGSPPSSTATPAWSGTCGGTCSWNGGWTAATCRSPVTGGPTTPRIAGRRPKVSSWPRWRPTRLASVA